MKLDEAYVVGLREKFAGSTGAESVIKDVVMVGAWLEEGRLCTVDEGVFSDVAGLFKSMEMPIASSFNLSVVDMNDTGEDFLKEPSAADLVILSCVSNEAHSGLTMGAASGLMTKDMSDLLQALNGGLNKNRNPLLQSPFSALEGAWEEACTASGAKAVVSFSYTPSDVSAQDFTGGVFRTVESEHIPSGICECNVLVRNDLN